MRTIQEVIKSLDFKEIEKAYFEEHPLSLEINDKEELSIDKYTKSVSEEFQQFLTEICEHPVKEGEHRGILFATKAPYDDSSKIIYTELIHEDELVAAEDINSVNTYAYELTPWDEMLNFYVADTVLTERNLMDLVVDFLDELSFFGYKESEQQEEINKLNEAIEEVESGENLKSFKSLDDMFNEYGWEKEVEYPEERVLRNACVNAVHKLYRYCMNIELNKIKKNIIKENNL